jgi:cytochrome c biogenesis protein ResB
MLTHLGIVLTLLASLYGAFTNFTAQVLLKPQESFTLAEAEAFRTSTPPPFWFGQVPEWEVVIQDVDITFQDNAPTVPKQFVSRLQVRDALTHEVLSEGVSSVNHPWVYDGVTFYQAQFSPTTQHQLRINGKMQIVDAKETLAGRPYTVLPIDANRRLFIFPLGRFTDGLPENRLHILIEKNGVLLGYGKGFKAENKNLWSLAEGAKPQTIEGIPIAYEKAIMATGLQIKYAPEVPLLYLSLIVFALGCVVSFVPHHQVWFALSAEEQEGNAPPTRIIWFSRSKKKKDLLEKSLHRVLSRLPLL